MKLFYREFGKGEPLVILHGLYGSSDNWVSIAKELEKYFWVILVDQRNHGQSPHSPDLNYSIITDDMFELFHELNLEKAILLGHSMGGKVAMQFTIEYPAKVSSLIVVDIAPWSHFSNLDMSTQISKEHRQIIEGLQSIPLNIITSRTQADEILSKWVKTERTRQFLLKNLKREQNGTFVWKLNILAIADNLKNLMDGIDPRTKNHYSNTKTLFIKGALSNYIPNSRIEELKTNFPNSTVITIEGSGHWVHAEKPNEFIKVVLKFLHP